MQCTKCLYTTAHPFEMQFDASGVCAGCYTHDEKYTLDWEGRNKRLKDLIAPYKAFGSNTWDCIIPVTGGGDSYFTVHYVKNILKMNPLLVSYNNLYNTALGFRNLANLRIEFDCDVLQFIPSPHDVRKITRYTLHEYLNIYWHSIAGQTVYPVQMAVKAGVPLIIWGAHQATEQVGMFSHIDEVEMSRWYRKNHDLFGIEAEDLYAEIPDLRDCGLEKYFYPDFADIDRVGVRGIYLSNYVPWNPIKQNALMAETYGFRGVENLRTFDVYDVPDQAFYYGLHDYSKQIKLGYAKVTDQLSREIRHGTVSREAAQRLNKFYLAQQPQGIVEFCDWLEISRASLEFLFDRFRLEGNDIVGNTVTVPARYQNGHYVGIWQGERSAQTKIVGRGFGKGYHD